MTRYPADTTDAIAVMFCPRCGLSRPAPGLPKNIVPRKTCRRCWNDTHPTNQLDFPCPYSLPFSDFKHLYIDCWSSYPTKDTP